MCVIIKWSLKLRVINPGALDKLLTFQFTHLYNAGNNSNYF